MLRSALLTAILNCLTIFVISSPFFMANASPTLKARSPALTVDISPSVIKTAIRQAAYRLSVYSVGRVSCQVFKVTPDPICCV